MHATLVDQPAPDTDTGTAIIVNAWTVSDGCQDEFVEMIVRLLDRIRTLDGFIEGELLQGVNPTRFVSYVRMRSTLDRRRALDDRQIRSLLRAVTAVAGPDLHNYDVLRVFRPTVA
jgi:hypothetical protein